ncbi:atypical chemokine receptor 3-like [Lethenteron reissneri]|uniref:atypical chemokine receptor 3-like n=1 Tax=Lethenteron reissneri TaxID=7753 RepID=UPI002AB75C48|nr:atypical chemokine receptor 3-like [Lethenteron reissneri]
MDLTLDFDSEAFLNFTDYWDLEPLCNESTDANCSSSYKHFECPQVLNKGAILIGISIVYLFIFVVGVAGNVAVFCFNVFFHKNRFETHLYVVNLAISNICIVLVMPVMVASFLHDDQWLYGNFLCKLTNVTFSVNLFAGVFFVTAMSVDRYITFVHFHEASSRRKQRARLLICAIAWLLAVVASLPEIIYIRAVTTPNGETHCRADLPPDHFFKWMAGITLLYNTLGFLVPFPMIVVSSVLLYRAIAWHGLSERNNGRTIVLVYATVFAVCWTPYHVLLLADALALLRVLRLGCALDEALYVGLHVAQCLAVGQCCVNPVLYCFVDKRRRQEFIRSVVVKFKASTASHDLLAEDCTYVTQNTECAVILPNRSEADR